MTDKAEVELTVAPALLQQLDWSGRVLTGDALLCQRALCQLVCDAGGDELLIVEENQPPLHETIQDWFDPPPDLARAEREDWRTTRTIDTGRGRRSGVCSLIASAGLTAWSDWPGLAQVLRIERTWIEHGQAKTCRAGRDHRSLPSGRGADRLLARKREYWAIEKRLHWCKEVTFGEDASLIHVGQGPQVMTTLRDTAVSMLHQHGIHRIAAILRAMGQRPDLAIAMVLGFHPAYGQALIEPAQGLDRPASWAHNPK